MAIAASRPARNQTILDTELMVALLVAAAGLKDLLDAVADSLGDFAGAFYRSDSHILAGRCRTFAERCACGDGMQGGQMTYAGGCTFGEMAGAFGRAFTDIRRAATDLSPSGKGKKQRKQK